MKKKKTSEHVCQASAPPVLDTTRWESLLKGKNLKRDAAHPVMPVKDHSLASVEDEASGTKSSLVSNRSTEILSTKKQKEGHGGLSNWAKLLAGSDASKKNTFNDTRPNKNNGGSTPPLHASRKHEKKSRTSREREVHTTEQGTRGSANNASRRRKRKVDEQKKGGQTRPERRNRNEQSNSLNIAFQNQKASQEARKNEGRGEASGAQKSQYIAMDCEMVGVGREGCRSALARCCLVDWDGEVIYDKYVVPTELVTDLRTSVSGITRKHLERGESFTVCRGEIAALLEGKIIVGHALHNDLKVLCLNHPLSMIRDTAKYRPYRTAEGSLANLRARSLKALALEHLGRNIQGGSHHPAEDARAALDLYKAVRHHWEASLSAARKHGPRAVIDQKERRGVIH